MGVPTSEVGYTSAMDRREGHEVHKDMWGNWGGGHFHILLLQIYYTLSGFRDQCCENNGLMWFKPRAKKNKFAPTLRRQVLPSPVG